jgi:hypothetical protein
MFGKQQTKPCPMCTAWIDTFNGIAITWRKTLTSRLSPRLIRNVAKLCERKRMEQTPLVERWRKYI